MERGRAMHSSPSESASACRTRAVIFAVSLIRWPRLGTGVKLSKLESAKWSYRENYKHTPGIFTVSEDMLERWNVDRSVSNCWLEISISSLLKYHSDQLEAKMPSISTRAPHVLDSEKFMSEFSIKIKYISMPFILLLSSENAMSWAEQFLETIRQLLRWRRPTHHIIIYTAICIYSTVDTFISSQYIIFPAQWNPLFGRLKCNWTNMILRKASSDDDTWWRFAFSP